MEVKLTSCPLTAAADTGCLDEDVVLLLPLVGVLVDGLLLPLDDWFVPALPLIVVFVLLLLPLSLLVLFVVVDMLLLVVGTVLLVELVSAVA